MPSQSAASGFSNFTIWGIAPFFNHIMHNPMNKMICRTSVVAFLLLFACTCALCAERQNRVSLDSLDYVFHHQDRYENIRQARIDSCRNVLRESPDSCKARLYNELFALYYGFQSDSAIVCASRGIVESRKEGNRHEEINSIINLATLYQVTGCFSDAKRLLDELDNSELDSKQLYGVFSCNANICDALEQIAADVSLKEKYVAKFEAYRDSSLMIEPDNIFVLTGKLIDDGRFNEALGLMRPFCDSLSANHSLAGPSAYVVSGIYEKMGNRELEMEYLIISAYSDLIHANKEYISLTKLAEMLYEQGDIVRAYNYLNRAIEDATACKARIRMEEAATMLAIVNTSFTNMNARWIKLLICISLVLMIMAVTLLFLIIYLRKQRMRLANANKSLTSSKSMLEAANSRIRESSNIKNTYITNLMLECIARIDSLESYRKSLRKMALSADFDSLRKELKSNDFSEAEWKSFYRTFDTTFLSLFPTFVDDFNRLFPPEHQIVHQAGKPLSPELRIYALIRLGIDSTEKIASLLRYSRATIYAYRSRTHLKAFNPDTFEDEVRKIASI